MALLAPFAASLIQMAISRTREYDADEDGVGAHRRSAGPRLSPAQDRAGRQPWLPLPQDQKLVNASHLMIANPFRGGGMRRMFSTHPPMKDRIAGWNGWPAGRCSNRSDAGEPAG